MTSDRFSGGGRRGEGPGASAEQGGAWQRDKDTRGFPESE